MAVPGMDATGIDSSDPLTKGDLRGGSSEPDTDENITAGENVSHVDDRRLLQLQQQAVQQSTIYLSSLKLAWDRSYRAYRNEHFSGSKYQSEAYKGRSKTFRPKTRSAVRKSLAATAKALFSTGDVVSIAPENDGDKNQTVCASLKQELINYRLSRIARRNGIPWFQNAMGARFNSLLTGICASKQQWLYKEKIGEDGQVEVTLDRPDIMLFPTENVLFDPNCDWTCPAQSSSYVILYYPMNLGDARQLINANAGAETNIPWREVSDSELKSATSTTGPQETQATRSARNGGKDPVAQAQGDFTPCWLTETFMRVDGEELVWWTINNGKIISDPVPVEQAYPEHHGERPIVIGAGELEAHRPYPMAPVESWQQLQQEANDTANLRLDHMKQVVAPPVKVMRGRKVDLNQVQRRAQNTIIQVQNMDDIEWAEVPDVPPSSYQESNYINADFDDLSGSFNGGSVQTNREMNETVGGMRLLAGSANTVADFDLEVFVETWVEPVLFQVLRLEEYYESDEKVLMIAGERAQLFQKFGVDTITDQMLLSESTLTVKVGVGSSNDPQQRLQNFMMAAGALQQIFTPFVEGGMLKVIPNGDEIMNTIFGAAGFKDGGERFFQVEPMDPGSQPNPAMLEQQNKAQELQLKDKKIQADAYLQHNKMEQDGALQDRKLKVEGAKHALNFEQARQKEMAATLRERSRAEAEIKKAELDSHHAVLAHGRDHAHERNMIADGVIGETLKNIFNPPPPPAPGGKGEASK
jgi:hypothetical protein